MNQRLIKTLRVFNESARTGSMSQAARQLNMTVSAVSQHLQKLEEELGLSLFIRNTRSMTLTEAGQLYFESTSAMIEQAEQLQSRLALLKQQPQGVLRLVAPAGFGGGLLSPPLKRLVDEFGDMGVDLTLTDEPRDLIKHGADLALLVGPLSDSQMIARQIAEWSMCLCVAKHHPLAQTAIQHPQELEHTCYISHIRETKQVSRLSHSTEGHHELKQRRLTVNNMQALIQLVKDGVGFAILPRPEVAGELASGELVELLPDWKLPNYKVYAVTPQRSFIPAKTQTAIDLIKEHFATIEDEPN